MVRKFERSNESNINRIIADIVADKVSVYSACRKFVDDLRVRGLASGTIYVQRSMLPGLFQSVLGEENFKKTVFERLVPSASLYVEHHKKTPTREDTVKMLKIADLKYKVIIGGLASGGFRIGEWLSRKMPDLEIRPEGYARVKLQAKETKAKYLRYSFLPRDIVECIQLLHANISSDWVIPGDRGRLNNAAAYSQIKSYFARVGLKDEPGESYTPHSFRTFAPDEMRACGLKEKAVLSIIGHRNALGADAHYTNWVRIENDWAASCSEKMCLITDNSKVQLLQDQNQKLERHNGKLETLLEKLLERITKENTQA